MSRQNENENVNTAAQAASADVGTMADVDEIMKKYDRESNVRPWEGVPALVIKFALALFSGFLIWMNLYANWDETIRRPLFLGIIVVFVFILFPARKSGGKPQKVNRIPFYDLILMALGASSFFYFVINQQSIVKRALRINQTEIILGIIGILILAECCRRVTGIPILIVAACFVLYAFVGADKSLRLVIYNLFYTTTGVHGTPIGVCSTYIALFIIFGSFLEATGIADFFIRCANRVAGAASGGPAKVAVISSALCGMVSGSSVGNTVTTGSVTIPMMKKTGYPGEFAGAVEAAASTGGQIMPPIMGAAAFLMAEMVGVPYSNIVVRAILPAFLYFTGIFLMVHLRAKRLGLKGIPKEELPKAKDILPNVYLLIPLVALVYLIIAGYTMSRAAIISTILCLIVSMFDFKQLKKPQHLLIPLIALITLVIDVFCAALVPASVVTVCKYAAVISVIIGVFLNTLEKDPSPNQMTVMRVIDSLETGARNTLSIGVACGVAGIIAGVVTMTGLGQVFISAIVSISGGHLIIALVLTMLCCILLGMGVPTTATYIIMATTCAPILTTGMGLNNISANMFVFYFGIVADITPPVALAAYAGAAIAKSDPMKTGFNASKLAIAAFLIPYMFCLNPAMLLIDTTPVEFVVIIITSIVGMFAIAAAIEGYMLRNLNVVTRLILAAAGLCLIYPGTMTDIIGTVVIVAVFVFEYSQTRRRAAAA